VIKISYEEEGEEVRGGGGPTTAGLREKEKEIILQGS